VQSLHHLLLLLMHARPCTFSDGAQWVYLPAAQMV
jgi:hypothetical protein